MDYLRQILAFNDRQLYNSTLSSGQISLWYALMSINNKTRWSKWFTAANQTLESLSGLSRSGILKARNILKQEGLIDFRPNGRKATSYSLCLLYTSNSTQESNDKVSIKSQYSNDKVSIKSQYSTPLIKQDINQDVDINKNISASSSNDIGLTDPEIVIREKFTLNIWPLFKKQVKFDAAFKAYFEDITEDDSLTDDKIIAAINNRNKYYEINQVQERFQINPEKYFMDKRYLDTIDLTPQRKGNGKKVNPEPLPEWLNNEFDETKANADQHQDSELADRIKKLNQETKP